ncbi:hypothetical protein K431DRAFT_316950 [Polychaeton citri CBS 116435]|uniref:Uncharacterized protein n=1 Tax=Polychaeton citri CBS 116435 TaxID=1314669 RepID=A0A9P4PXU6_9PEZI|nr:hypothetical protein K431DRAFT_316950 [Polychaeton citri CBS 116435]
MIYAGTQTGSRSADEEMGHGGGKRGGTGNSHIETPRGCADCQPGPAGEMSGSGSGSGSANSAFLPGHDDDASTTATFEIIGTMPEVAQRTPDTAL